VKWLERFRFQRERESLRAEGRVLVGSHEDCCTPMNGNERA